MPFNVREMVENAQEAAREAIAEAEAEDASPPWDTRWGMNDNDATATVEVENLPLIHETNASRNRGVSNIIRQIDRGNGWSTERTTYDLVEDFVDSGNVGEVQELLVEAGLLSGSYQIGFMDDKTATAIGRAGRFASQNNMGFYDYLFAVGSRVQGGGGGGGRRRGGGGGGGRGRAFVAPNPDDLKDQLRNLTREVTGAGGNLTDEMADEFVSQFTAQLQGATTTEPQSFEGSAMSYIEEQLGAQVESTKLGAVFQGISDYVSRPFVGA